jgi:hypothetical protein
VGVRTPDPLLAKQVLYQLSYIPERESLLLSRFDSAQARRAGGVEPETMKGGGSQRRLPSRGHSSAGRALRWQRKGQEFESPCLHQRTPVIRGRFLSSGTTVAIWLPSLERSARSLLSRPPEMKAGDVAEIRSSRSPKLTLAVARS